MGRSRYTARHRGTGGQQTIPGLRHKLRQKIKWRLFRCSSEKHWGEMFKYYDNQATESKVRYKMKLNLLALTVYDGPFKQSKG